MAPAHQHATSVAAYPALLNIDQFAIFRFFFASFLKADNSIGENDFKIIFLELFGVSDSKLRNTVVLVVMIM